MKYFYPKCVKVFLLDPTRMLKIKVTNIKFVNIDELSTPSPRNLAQTYITMRERMRNITLCKRF